MTSTTTTTTTKTSKSASAKTYPMPAALGSMSITAAIAEFRLLDERVGLIPATAQHDLHAALETIQQTATRLGIVRADQLVTDHKSLLSTLTGVAAITQFHDSATAEPLHLFRNLLLAIAAAATGTFNGDPRGLYQRMTALRARTHSHRRPLTDDEIVLLRTMVHLEGGARTAKGPKVRPAIYALVESGMTPGETTHFSLGDITGDHENVDMVLAAGNGHIEARFLPVDTFNALVLSQLTQFAHETGTARNTTLTYTGRVNVPGSVQATASSQRILDRLLDQAGVANTDTTATSIRLWRLEKAYRAQGDAYAQELAGYGAKQDDVEKLWRTMGFMCSPTENSTLEDAGTSFDI